VDIPRAGIVLVHPGTLHQHSAGEAEPHGLRRNAESEVARIAGADRAICLAFRDKLGQCPQVYTQCVACRCRHWMRPSQLLGDHVREFWVLVEIHEEHPDESLDSTQWWAFAGRGFVEQLPHGCRHRFECCIEQRLLGAKMVRDCSEVCSRLGGNGTNRRSVVAVSAEQINGSVYQFFSRVSLFIHTCDFLHTNV